MLLSKETLYTIDVFLMMPQVFDDVNYPCSKDRVFSLSVCAEIEMKNWNADRTRHRIVEKENS